MEEDGKEVIGDGAIVDGRVYIGVSTKLFWLN
jgi:hypothetical protein